METNNVCEPLISEILPGLFVGGTDDWDTIDQVQRLAQLTEPVIYDSVASLYAFSAPMGWHVHEMRFGFQDGPLNDLSKQKVREIAQWLHGEWKGGRRVLARCQAGINRSCLTIALVLLQEGFSAEAAIELIRAKRFSYALSNQHFVQFIHDEEERMNKGTLAA
jgi:hypothetical protein